jgi:hypothetical protein
MALLFNDNQKKIYNRYIIFNKYKSIIEQKGKDITFFNKLCGNSSLEVKNYLIALGITDNTIIESMIYAAKECDLTTMNITSEESSDLNKGNLFIVFLHNFFISYYSPYYDLFNKLMLIITTIDKIANKSEILWSKINKTIFNNKLNIVNELINELSPNKNMIDFFDLNNIKNILSTIDITCNANECFLSNSNDKTLNTKIDKLMNSKIANNLPIMCINFLIKDFDTNFFIKEDNTSNIKIKSEEEDKKTLIKQEETEKNNKLYLIISAGIIAIIIIITVIVLIIRRNNYYNYMYPYGNSGYGGMGYGGMGYGGMGYGGMGYY